MITKGPVNSGTSLAPKQRSDSPGNSNGASLLDSHIQESLAGILETGIISSMSDLTNPIEPSARQNVRARRKSASVLLNRQSKDWSDLGIPYPKKASFSPKHINSETVMKRADLWAENARKSVDSKSKLENSSFLFDDSETAPLDNINGKRLLDHF